jgi:perosamine synthetase
MVGYNYRMPNLNAALLVAQLENLDFFLMKKRELSVAYVDFFYNNTAFNFVKESADSRSNYWLNAVILQDKKARDLFLNETNLKGVATRPIWTLMNKLPMFKYAQCGDLENSRWLEERIVNIPSSVIL